MYRQHFEQSIIWINRVMVANPALMIAHTRLDCTCKAEHQSVELISMYVVTQETGLIPLLSIGDIPSVFSIWNIYRG